MLNIKKEILRDILIDQIKPYSKNYIKHDKNIEHIKNSLKEFGYIKISVGVDENNVMLFGHGTVLAAKELGWASIPEVVKISGLTNKQQKAYRIIDNESASRDIDFELLHYELEELKSDYDMVDFGVDTKYLLQEDTSEKDNMIPDKPKIPRTIKGDLYELGEHRILCGDSTILSDVKKLMNGQKADMCFTDPPYGIEIVKNNKVGANFGVTKKGIYAPIKNDNATKVMEACFDLLIGLNIKKVIIWGGNYFLKFLPVSDSWIIWDKRGDSGIRNTFADGEMAWCSFHTPIRIYKQLWNGMIREGEKEKRLHPTQKPINLLCKIIEDFAKKENIIIDLFGGSGSILIACEKTNRKCFMQEIDPIYVDVIIQRWVDYTGIEKIKRNGKEVEWKKSSQ